MFQMFVPALVHLVLTTTCTDHDIGLSLSTKYQTRVAAEAAALHADGGQCHGCCDDNQRTESVYGNCSLDLPLLALTKGMSLQRACSFVRTTLFVYTGSAHLRAFMSAMEADVPAGLSGEADLIKTWCGFTCSPTCAGHPPSSPPAPQLSSDGDSDPLLGAIARVSMLDRSLGWVAWLWVGLIAAQAAAALLVYARHRRFLAQLRAHAERSRHVTRRRPGLPARGMLPREDEVVTFPRLHSWSSWSLARLAWSLARLVWGRSRSTVEPPPPAASAATMLSSAPTLLSSTRLDASRRSATGGPDGTLALPPARCPMSLAFCEVSYHTPEGTELIAGVTGYVRPGEVLAVMGESGSGKTTCLSVLAGRAGPGRVGGQIHVNGELRAPGGAVGRRFAAQSGYMLQTTGAVCDELTARENLSPRERVTLTMAGPHRTSRPSAAQRPLAARVPCRTHHRSAWLLPSTCRYAALLHLPSATCRARLQRVDEVLAQLQLCPRADQRIGSIDDARGGLSGGERRRLMLAVQLLALPGVLFCDEPTSGLDARSAKQVTRLLRGCGRG